jgi:hypothetical protein
MGGNEVDCPTCRDASHTVVRKVVHIYPQLLLGLPTFWSFMSPTLARAVTGGIGVVAIALVLLGVATLSQDSAVASWAVGLAAALSIYIGAAVPPAEATCGKRGGAIARAGAWP